MTGFAPTGGRAVGHGLGSLYAAVSNVTTFRAGGADRPQGLVSLLAQMHLDHDAELQHRDRRGED